MMVYSRFSKIIIDENRLIIKIVNVNPNRRNCKLHAMGRQLLLDLTNKYPLILRHLHGSIKNNF